MINNYVKSGVLPPPKNKKYNRTHLAILMIVCITKPVMEISAISEIIHRGIKTAQMENVLNGLAEKFENELSSAAQNAAETAETSSHGEILSLIAIENVMKANAARTIAMHAYNTIKADESEDAAKTEKVEKKAEKKKAKKEAEHSETAEKSEENA
jgi:aspartokinase